MNRKIEMFNVLDNNEWETVKKNNTSRSTKQRSLDAKGITPSTGHRVLVQDEG